MLALSARPYDLVILGATGFTGRLACEYLAAQPAQVEWCAAGRSAAKLAELGAPNVELCDVSDAAAVDRLVSQARVVANYAGSPFIDKALPVVAACAKHGTHYVDITGENPLQRASYDMYHDEAAASGALIVHQCGYDSVPSDLAAFLAVRHLKASASCGAEAITTLMGKASGGISGGTLATMIALRKGFATNAYPGMAECSARGAYGLDPAGGKGGPDTMRSTLCGGSLPIGYDTVLRKWRMPGIMAVTNAPVVRKSSALLDYGCGTMPTYTEAQATPGAISAAVGLLGLSLVGMLVAFPLTRWLLFALGILPKPGEGPSRATMDSGYFEASAYATGKGGQHVAVARFGSGNTGDPGYRATACMSVESALCLALERERCAAGGVLTPASAFGMVLVDRLNKSGMEISVDSLKD